MSTSNWVGSMSGLILAGKASLCGSILVARRSSGMLPSNNLKDGIGICMEILLIFYLNLVGIASW